jgi:tRNA pseudouridine55 synthase
MTKTPDQTPEVAPGLIVLDKPPQWTSHDCVARVRRLAGTKKVGHAGTLDPLATGVLVLGVGRATRFLTHLVGLDKEYAATIRLGQATTTDDAAGRPLGGAPAQALSPAQVEAAIEPLRGKIEQVPSAVSAIKVDGRRAHARVRAGEDVVLAPRPVEVSRFEVLGRRVVGERLDLDVIVRCSSGTYVRALARDLGAALGVGGHLTALRRLRLGPFQAQAATTLARLATDFAVLPLAAAAAELFPVARLDAAEAQLVARGQAINPRDQSWRGAPAGPGPQDRSSTVRPRPDAEGLVAALGPDGVLVALALAEGAPGRLRPKTVFA